MRIVRKMNELDKLKQILLDNKSVSMFNYLPKPVIKARNNKKLSSSTSMNPNDKEIEYGSEEAVLKLFKLYQ